VEEAGTEGLPLVPEGRLDQAWGQQGWVASQEEAERRVAGAVGPTWGVVAGWHLALSFCQVHSAQTTTQTLFALRMHQTVDVVSWNAYCMNEKDMVQSTILLQECTMQWGKTCKAWSYNTDPNVCLQKVTYQMLTDSHQPQHCSWLWSCLQYKNLCC